MNLFNEQPSQNVITHLTVFEHLKSQIESLKKELKEAGVDKPALFDILAAYGFFAADVGIAYLKKEELERLQQEFFNLGGFIKQTIEEEYPE